MNSENFDTKDTNYFDTFDSKYNNFSISLTEIHKKQREKEHIRLKIYKIILSRCFLKIKNSSIKEETFCFFELPEYLPGLPLYNLTECVMFILNNLKEKGFNAKYAGEYLLFVSWNLPKPNLKITEKICDETNRPKPLLTDISNMSFKMDPKPTTPTTSSSTTPTTPLTYKPTEFKPYKPIETYQSSNQYLFNKFSKFK